MDKETILVSLHHFNEKPSGTGFELATLFGSFARGTQDLYSNINITYKIDHDLFYEKRMNLNFYPKSTKMICEA